MTCILPTQKDAASNLGRFTGSSLDVRAGEVAALLGENGAGKSTLAKIIAGVTHQYAGTLELEDAEQAFRSPRAAMDAGVSLIPQELIYVPELSMAENVCLGRMPSTAGSLATTRTRR